MSVMGSITVHVPLPVRRRPGRKTVVRPDGRAYSPSIATPSIATHADPAMVKALARAFRWKRMLDDGRYASISEIAAAEKIDRGYVGSILRLTLLAPDIVEMILDGQQPDGLGLPALLKPFPVEWGQQRAELSADVGSPEQATGNETIASPAAPRTSSRRRRTRRPMQRSSATEAVNAAR
jgi:hypothetical protein